MPRVKIRLKKGEAAEVTKLANGLADKLICQNGLRIALVVSRLVNEKVFASYKSMERKYPNEKIDY